MPKTIEAERVWVSDLGDVSEVAKTGTGWFEYTRVRAPTLEESMERFPQRQEGESYLLYARRVGKLAAERYDIIKTLTAEIAQLRTKE